jgi:hypothetical protein
MPVGGTSSQPGEGDGSSAPPRQPPAAEATSGRGSETIASAEPRLEWEMLRPIAPLIYVAMGFDVLTVMFAVLIGPSWPDTYLNIMSALLGMGLSIPVGMLASPLGREETFTFSSIGKALVTFGSGYLLSKLDPAITVAVGSDYLFSRVGVFRVVAFVLCFGVGVPTMYMARRQWAAKPTISPDAGPAGTPKEKQNS